MPVHSTRADYDNALPKWQRLRDCYNGRDAVLAGGVKYVPALKGLDNPGNVSYRERGSFYNAIVRTVQGINGLIFQEAPEVEISETYREYLDDITLSNISFETMAVETGKEVFLTGRYGVLVDMPDKAAPDNRPYCVTYKAEDIINWRVTRLGGDEVLTMVVLRETAEEPPKADDPFCADTITQYRVLMLKDGKCIRQLYRKKDDKWEPYEEEVTLTRREEPLTFVPFTFFGALAPTPDVEQPPLIDLADVNLGHWRNSCDYEYGLHLVALPTPWVAGAKGSSDGAEKAIGPSVVWELDVQGSAGMLEFTGSGLKAISDAMEEKKKQMATLGARLLEDQASTQETAQAVKLRHGGQTASLRTVAQALEQGFTQVLQTVVWWAGLDTAPVDADVEVELNKEYLDIKATPDEIRVALTALQAGEMSFETWYHLLQTGGWAREGVDVKQEQKDISTRKVNVDEPAGPVPPVAEE